MGGKVKQMQYWEWLTESGHLFGQVGTKSPKQATVGQQVERGVASHGVEGERVDSRWEAGHVTHLLFPVGSHGDGAHPGVCGRPLGEGSSSHYTWKSLEELKKVSFWSLSGCGDWMGNDGGFTEGRLASTLEESSNFLRERRKRNMLFLSDKSSTYNKDKCFWLAWTYWYNEQFVSRFHRKNSPHINFETAIHQSSGTEKRLSTV